MHHNETVSCFNEAPSTVFWHPPSSLLAGILSRLGLQENAQTSPTLFRCSDIRVSTHFRLRKKGHFSLRFKLEVDPYLIKVSHLFS